MKCKLYSNVLFLLYGAFLILGCSKSQVGVQPPASSKTDHQPTAYLSDDSSVVPDYGNNISVAQTTGSNALVKKNIPGGKYVTWPSGLVIDSITGAVDVRNSEPGGRYNLGHVNMLTGDTAYRQLVLAGATYPDGVYDTTISSQALSPYYICPDSSGWTPVAKVQGYRSVFSGWKVDDGSNATNGDPLSDSGSIRIKDILAKARKKFSGGKISNGAHFKLRVQYGLNLPAGSSALQSHMNVYFFNTLADVPNSYIKQCQASQKAMGITNIYPGNSGLNSKTRTGGGSNPVVVPGVSTVASGSGSGSSDAVMATASRPPYILIIMSGLIRR